MAKKPIVITEADYDFQIVKSEHEINEWVTLGELVDRYGREAKVFTDMVGYDPCNLKVQVTRLETGEERDARIAEKQAEIERLAQLAIAREKKEKEQAMKRSKEYQEYLRLTKKFG